MTVKMKNPETGKEADIHPNEVEHMKSHGWEEAQPDSKPEVKKRGRKPAQNDS